MAYFTPSFTNPVAATIANVARAVPMDADTILVLRTDQKVPETTMGSTGRLEGSNKEKEVRSDGASKTWREERETGRLAREVAEGGRRAKGDTERG